MITPVLRSNLAQGLRHARCFSSSPMLAAQEVKRLGVVGAGQMVFPISASISSTTLTDGILGPGNSISSCAKGWSTCHISRYEPGVNR